MSDPKPEIKNVYDALLRVQGKKLIAKRDAQAYNYKYADLEQIWSLLYEPLQEAGLVVVQTPDGDNLTTVVNHPETETMIESSIPLVVSTESNNHMQDLGAAITYARRYVLTSMFNIVVNDDDNQSNTTETPTKSVKLPTGSPTASQLSLIKTLSSKKGITPRKVETKSEASDYINELMAAKDQSNDIPF